MKLVSIRFKVAIAIVLILLVSVSISIYISVRNQKKNLLEAMENNLSVSNGILSTVIGNLMLSGEAPLANQTLSQLKSMPEFKDIAIYRIDGTLAFSDYSTIDKVNAYQFMTTFEKTPRSKPRKISGKDFETVLKTHTPRTVELFDKKEMDYYFPLLNLPQCRSCHGETPFIRGVAHYKVSVAGIFSRIDTARNILMLFFILSGIVIAFLLIWIMQKMVIHPLLSIGGVVSAVGEGNFNVRVDKNSNDELGDLAIKINGMIGDLKEKTRLELENKEIETKNRENKKYLDNIREGLLLLDEDLIITSQYSRFLEELFNKEDFAGMKFVDFIYPDQAEQSEERAELEQFLTMVFKNTKTDMEMIMAINPLKNKKLTVSADEGKDTSIIIDASFQRIFSENTVENVMVIFEDRTQIITMENELETEKKRSQSELEQIAAILKAGPEYFLDFITDASIQLQEGESCLAHLDKKEEVEKLFRILHSLKGTARYMDLKIMADKVHEVETVVAGLRDSKTSRKEEKQEDLRIRIRSLSEELESIRNLVKRFSSFKTVTGDGDIPVNENVALFFDSLKRMVSDISTELGKEVILETKSNMKGFTYLKILRDPLIHLVRNSLDHGLEDTYERLSLGKEEPAKIILAIYRDDKKGYTITIEDNGKGIDFKRIKEIALDRGLLKEDEATRKRLLKLLFSSGFSSRKEVSSLSGRGVGLDVVYAVIRSLKGSISVASVNNKGTQFTIKVPAEKERGIV